MTDADQSDRYEDHSRTQVGALQALVAAAGRHNPTEFATVPRFCDESVLSQIISLAWRHQFDDSRAFFRRDMVELQAYVAGRARLEARKGA